MGMLHLKFVVDSIQYKLSIKIAKMNSLLGLAILSAFTFGSAFAGKCEPLFTQTSPSNWGDVRQGHLEFPIPEATTKWRVDIIFDKPVHTLNPWDGANGKCQTNKKRCSFTNAGWNAHKNAGNLKLGMETRFDHSSTPPKFKKIIFKYWTPSGSKEKIVVECGEGSGSDSGSGSGSGGATNPPATEGPTANPTTADPSATTEEAITNGQCKTQLTNYKDAIHKSLLFYEAQRSGKLPADNRIPWARDSALDDGSDVGVDLSGGYYDAGDYVNFNLPGAQALTTLAWGGISYAGGYKCAGEWENLLDAIKWGTDYFIKCHVSDNEYYAQVGNGEIDHATWSRPEDMTGARPSYKIDCNKPGSDVAAETAASFASAAILFKGEDDKYSAKLLDHAKRMYKFADTCRGKYSDSIYDASIFYKSWSGYNDELVWGAAWLYKATGDVAYFNKAKKYYDQFGLEGKIGVFSWDDKTVGVHALMAEFTGEKKYTDSLKKFCDHAINDQTKSPGGMLHYMQWGSLRYAANAAFMCLQAADLVDGKENAYTDLAQGQMDYILGGNPKGQSFLIGFGSKYPQNPHHSRSSCPNPPASCGWNDYSNGPTTNELIGALVGGCKNADDNYNDARDDYFSNEVTLDYNAGFQSTVAGLQMKKCCSA